MDSDPQLKSRIGSVGNQFAIMSIIALLTSIPLMFMKEVRVSRMRHWRTTQT